jgi:hypothetical protein
MKIIIVFAKEGQISGSVKTSKITQAGENGISTSIWESWSLYNVNIQTKD